MEKTIKILFLEHDPDIYGQLLLELKKSSLNFLVEVVQTRAAYERALDQFSPDIILSDATLACFDWYLAFGIRQKLRPETPFIIISGLIGEENAVELIKMGMTDYVLKEKLYLLAPKIQRALQEAAGRSQKEAAEGQLRQSEQQLRQIMDLSLDLICTLDQQGRFVTMGAASESILGYASRELIGKKAVNLIHQQDRGKTIQAVVALQHGVNLINFENRLIRKNGTPVPLLWSVHWNPEENLRYCVGRDATEIKKAQQKINDSEAKYRNLFSLSPTPMWVYDEETFTFLDVNEAAMQHYGYSKEEFLNMHLQDIWPDQDQDKLGRLAKAPQHGSPFYRYASRHVKKNGEVIDVDIKANPVELAGSKARLVIASDISERMKYIQAIEAQNQRFREIAWTQSHVVRAPLARMMGLVSLLKGYPLEKLNDTNILNLIAASAHELDTIIRKIVRKAEQVDDLPQAAPAVELPEKCGW